jgi:RNA polymerase sigma-70 factor (ECF subfamily)
MQSVDSAVFPRTPGGAIPDDELVRRVRSGETALFEVLMRRYNPRLFRVARAILRDDHEAEDVMQQAYVNAFVHLEQFAGRASFATWLTRIAAHEAIARARQRDRIAVLDASESGEETRGTGPDPEHQAYAAELRRLLESAVDGLPESHRLVFMLREVEGLNTAETAECLEISEETVKTRLHRSRAMLRHDLLERTGAVTPGAFQFHLSRCDRVVAGVMARIAPAGR